MHLYLLGYPLGHSLSPAIHNAAFREAGLEDWRYELLPVPPEALPQAVERVRAADCLGGNVTIPHKEAIIPLLDTLTPAAQAIGAVNTLFKRDGLLWGDNTDAEGFWVDVQRVFGDLPAGEALLLGAGGAARAVAYALARRGWRVTVAARRLEQAEALCRSLVVSRQSSVISRQWSVVSGQPSAVSRQSSVVSGQWSVVSRQSAMVNGQRSTVNGRPSAFSLQPSSFLIHPSAFPTPQSPIPTPQSPILIVNCTPVGMHPHTEASPWPAEIPFPAGARVYDLVYNPAETRLMQQARAAGLPAANGLGMLRAQAALAFRRWTADGGG